MKRDGNRAQKRRRLAVNDGEKFRSGNFGLFQNFHGMLKKRDSWPQVSQVHIRMLDSY